MGFLRGRDSQLPGHCIYFSICKNAITWPSSKSKVTTAMLCNQLRKPSQSFSEPIFTKKVNNIQVEPKYPGVIISRKVSVFSQSFHRAFLFFALENFMARNRSSFSSPLKFLKNIDIEFCTEDLEHRNNKSLPAIAVTTNQEDNKAQE